MRVRWFSAQAHSHRVGMAVESFTLRQLRDGATRCFQRGSVEGNHRGVAHEGLDAKCTTEAGGAAGGERVVRAGKVVADSFG